MEIAGIGTAVPSHRISQVDSAAISKGFAAIPDKRVRMFDELYRRTGVATRHSVVLDASDGELADRQSFYGASSPPTSERMRVYRDKAEHLAIESSMQAIAETGLAPDRITHLVTVSCTGFHAPGFDIALAKRLPLRPSIARTHVGFMGCQGALNGLRIARAFTEADPSACVLLCSTELCSLHHHYGWDPEKIVANALFADGSAAAILTGRSLRSRERRLRLVASGSTLVEDSTDAMSWKIGDHGFEMTLSPKVPGLISAIVPPWLEHWLRQHGRSVDEIRSWAVHPGGPRILAAFGEAMGLPRSALASSYETLSSYGNMSSATILFTLKALRDRHADAPMVAIAFGPGLTVEAVLLE
jgi:prepilin-type processing-associated H-X9-DG protein